jgi:hypothetical protein
MWLFDSKNKAWQQIEAKDTPEVIFPSLSLEEDTLWSNMKITYLCLEEYKMSPSKKMTSTFFNSPKISGTKYTPRPTLFMTAPRRSKKTKRYYYFKLRETKVLKTLPL